MGEGEVRQRKKKSQHSSNQSAHQKISPKGDGGKGRKATKQGKNCQQNPKWHHIQGSK